MYKDDVWCGMDKQRARRATVPEHALVGRGKHGPKRQEEEVQDVWWKGRKGADGRWLLAAAAAGLATCEAATRICWRTAAEREVLHAVFTECEYRCLRFALCSVCVRACVLVNSSA